MALRFPPVLALDCGASRVSAVVFGATTDGVPVVREVMVEPLESDATDDIQWTEAVGDAIRRIVSRHKIRGSVSLIVPGHLTLTKFIRVPHVDEARREKIIQFEARQNIPYPLDEVVWDYQIVYDDGVDFEVALCAIKLDIVNALIAQCRESGIDPTVIEPSCMAQVNAFRFSFAQARQSTLLINIGARSSNLLFFREDRFFVRNITLGGSTVSQAIADELGQGLAEAERIKREIGAHGVTAAVPAGVSTAYDNARQSFAGRLALEVTRSIANFRRQGGEAPVEVHLTGAASVMPELATILAERLKLPVGHYEPLRRVQIAPNAVEGEIRAAGHLIGEAVGAALRAFDQGVAAVNLLPRSVLAARAFRRRQPYLFGALAFVAGALAVGLLLSGVTVAAYEEKIATLDAQSRPLRHFATEIQRIGDDTERLRQEISGIKGLVDTKANWISFFRDLQSRLVKVEDVWLDKVQVLRPQTQVQTSALAGSLFAGLAPQPAKSATGGEEAQSLRLNITGRLLDKNNPTAPVSLESQNRVKTLLSSFVDSEFILAIENERFDTSQPGILKFDFILVVDSKRPL